VRITETRLINSKGFDVTSVAHGAPLTVRVLLSVSGPAVGAEATFVLAFTRHGTSFAVNVVEHHLFLPAPTTVVDVTLPAVRLGSGVWFLRVGVGEAGIFQRGTLSYFAVDSRWYHMMREGIRFEVQSVDHLDSAGCFMVHEGRFDVRGADPLVEPIGSASAPGDSSL